MELSGLFARSAVNHSALRWRRGLRGFARLCVLAIFANACNGEPPRSGSTTSQRAELSRFAAGWLVQDSILLASSDSFPLVRLSGFDSSPDGGLLVADASEGNVKRYDATGRLLGVIGRKGAGPGEFQAPRYPRTAPDGRIYVADGGQPRVSIYSADGLYERDITLQDFAFVMGFEVLDANRMLFTAMRSSAREVLFVVDSVGNTVASYLPIKDLSPGGQANPLWAMVRQFWLGARGDSAYVVSTLSDSIWTVNVETGYTQATRLQSEEYRAPMLPDSPPDGASAITAWQKSFHIAAAIYADSTRIVVPFVRGILNYGDPAFVAVREGTTWAMFSEAPPVVAAEHGALVQLMHPESADAWIAFLRRKQ